MECVNHDCQICNFIKESMECTVQRLTVTDVIEGKLPMPFTSRAAWKSTQQDCASLRRAYAHLSQATRPNRKATKIKDVKRYLRVCTLGRDGILVVKDEVPFLPTRELLVVSRHVLPGLLTALHLKLQHPTI